MLFACTGSSYLVGADREAELVGMAELEFGIPVITATRAIAEELRRRKAQKIAILAPYPQALVDASVDYWEKQHFEIVNVERIDIGADTRAIYELTDADVAKAIAGFDTANADLVLLSGTGMPTLVQLRKDPARFISSNYCLAMAAYRMLVGWPETDAGIPSALLAPGNAH